MTDPKTFTGPGGYMFTLYDGPVPSAAGVVVAYPGAPLDHGTWIPLAELRAFVTAHASEIFVHAGVDPGAGSGVDEPHNHWCSKPCGAPGCWGGEITSHHYDPNGARGYKSAVSRTVGTYAIDPGSEPGQVVEPELCERCAKLRAQCRAEGKAGFVLCGTCAPRVNPPSADEGRCSVCGCAYCECDEHDY